MQFFRVWGKDFATMRTINKRIKAAYHDHLKNTVNVGSYLATYDKNKLKDAKF